MRLIDQVPALSDSRIVVELQRLLALLGDGHSLVYPMPTARMPFTMLPIDVYLFSDGLFVVDAPEGLRALIGARITHIGDRKTEDLLRDLEPFVSRDNAMGVKTFAVHYLIAPAFLEALGAASTQDRVRLRVADEGSGGREVALTAGPARRVRKKLLAPRGAANPPPMYLEDVDRSYWVRPLDAPGVVYLQFNQVMDDPAEPLVEFSRRVADTLSAAGATALVVDVRHNNGGNNTLLEPLLTVISRFAAEGQGRRVYVITSRTTFSAAQNFINRLERRVPGATFAGEPSMSSPNFTGEDAPVTLPFSGVTVSISNRYWEDSVASDRRPWIQPRLDVPLSSSDWLTNRDPVLDAVLRDIEANRPSEGRRSPEGSATPGAG
jgi:hypothetical protein